MDKVNQFGRLSRLQVQLTKSKIIFSITAVDTRKLHGIPVMRHGNTVQYLGYAIGVGDLATVNWAAQVRNVQGRLVTATRLDTSFKNSSDTPPLRALPLGTLAFYLLFFDKESRGNPGPGGA